MNTDKMNPVVAVTIGKLGEFKLEFNFWAIAQYKTLTGKNLLTGEIDARDATDLVAVLWAGLVTHHPEFDGYFIGGTPPAQVQKSLKALGSAIDPFVNLGEISAKIIEALTRSKHVPSEEGLQQKKEEAPAQ